ncbi:MAG: prolyl oligopeptidase family serine peptidase [Bacteroidales bacterium]|nr:prolyl oligopeptidase family serine peptidase [Bacteroidales bacterium]
MRFAASFAIALLAIGSSLTLAQQPKKPPTRSYPQGEKMIAEYFANQVQQITDHCLTNLTTQADWEKRRPELRRQFLEMMGLWPLPARTDLKPVITGKVEGEGFTVEKVHFQSWPGLYVTANLYLPKDAATTGKKYPTILYVCGHGNVVIDGVSYGSKVHYQYHPAWFATHGYVAIVLDTLQLSEIPGLHHGTHHLNLWWWQTRGYTPAGIECWNAMRALDYLETRPEVDTKHIGVTGRSGGGATSWWILAADERPQAFVPVAGIADLEAHLCHGAVAPFQDGVISGHCDCMYPVNSYRWDFSMVAALAAPRALLLGNSDNDRIFPVDGYRRIAEKVRKVYALYGPAAEEKFQLLETKGPHVDTPELRIGINKWMNRWLKGDTTTPVQDDLPPKLTPQQLKVLDRTPEGAINATVHEYFIKPATQTLPTSDAVIKEWWPARRGELMKGLTEKVFAGWPQSPPPLAAKLASDVTKDGVRLRAIDFVSEAGIPLRLFVQTAAGADAPKQVILSVLDDAGWEKWCRDLGPQFAEALQHDGKLEQDAAMFAQNRAAMKTNGWAFAAIAPRGVGPTKWADAGTPTDIHIRRRFALIGQTLDGQRVWDIRRALAVLPTGDGLQTTPIRLQGTGESGILALYAGLFEPSVTGFDLWQPPTTHRDGPTFLNVARILDIPQAIALAGPRPVTLHVPADQDARTWDWPLRVQRANGQSGLSIKSVGE